MQKLDGDGLAFVHAGGTVLRRELQARQTLLVDTGCLVAMTPNVNFEIQYVGKIKTALFGGEGLFFAKLTGPGTVWLQSRRSRLASRVFAAALQTGRGGREEGLVLAASAPAACSAACWAATMSESPRRWLAALRAGIARRDRGSRGAAATGRLTCRAARASPPAPRSRWCRSAAPSRTARTWCWASTTCACARSPSRSPSARQRAGGAGDRLHVPEGSIEPPQSHMRLPGTLSIPEPAFEAMLRARR